MEVTDVGHGVKGSGLTGWRADRAAGLVEEQGH